MSTNPNSKKLRFDLAKIDNIENYVLRGYIEDESASDYFGVCTIVKHADGLHEPLGWLTRRGSNVSYHKQGMEFLLEQGFRVAFTFEVALFDLYQRLLRPVGELKIIRQFTKTYAGREIHFYYGEIVKWSN